MVVLQGVSQLTHCLHEYQDGGLQTTTIDSNLEDSFVEDKIIDVLPGCTSSPAGKQSCPSNNQVYEFLKSFIHLDSDSVVGKYNEQFVGKT